MFPVWLITMNYQNTDQTTLKSDLKKLGSGIKKIGKYFASGATAVFNVFMRPCSVQNQIEEARLAEIRLRRRISIL